MENKMSMDELEQVSGGLWNEYEFDVFPITPGTYLRKLAIDYNTTVDALRAYNHWLNSYGDLDILPENKKIRVPKKKI